MKRRLAALLTCALLAFGQRSGTSPSPAKPTTRYLDLVALDAEGRPVPDLRLEDFELTETGAGRKIVQATWFDARRHTATGGTTFEFEPDDIHRNFVAIVDDLGLPVEGIAKVQGLLRAFVKDQMGSGERMAVLRTSSGGGVLQELTDDRRILTEAIDRIQFLGGHAAERTSSGANWLALRNVLQGLRQLPGRKFVVLFSQNPGAAGAHDPAAATLFGEANAAMAVVYGVDPRGPPRADSPTGKNSPLEQLARESGGMAGAELGGVLWAEEGFYGLSFEEPPAELGPLKAWNDAVEVKVRRPGITIRARTRSLRIPARQELAAPPERALEVRQALGSPFQGFDIRAQMTALFVNFVGQSAAVEAGVLIDARDLGTIREANGKYRQAVRLMTDAISDQGASTVPIERAYDIEMQQDAFELAQRNGLYFKVTLRLPPGQTWSIRALASDGITGRLGSAVQVIEIPQSGVFSLSGVNLRAFDPTGGKSPTIDPKENGAARIFRIGRPMEFLYAILNPAADENKQAQVEIKTRVYSGIKSIFEGKPSEMTYPVQGGTLQQVMGRLTLASNLAPGDYILEVTVTDKRAPAGSRASVSRFIDFQLRE